MLVAAPRRVTPFRRVIPTECRAVLVEDGPGGSGGCGGRGGAVAVFPGKVRRERPRRVGYVL